MRNATVLRRFTGRVAALAIVPIVTLAPGCDDGPRGKLHAKIDAPEPKHPAMKAGVRVAESRPAPHSAMPANHPPIARDGGATSSRTGAGAATAPASTRPAPELDADGRLRVAAVSFQLPEGMENQPPSSSMRLAQIGLPGDTPEASGEMTVMEARGGIAQNVDRWSGQFAGKPPARTETREVGGARVTVVRIEGDFHGMRRPGASGEAQEDSMLLGAVVEVPGRDALLFFKGVGPRSTMERWIESFDGLVNSIRVE